MGDRFGELRKQAGFITQESLAGALGLKNRSAIAKWETGERYPRTRLVPEVAKLLNVTEGEIIASISAARQNGT